jgi:hypothetical protein
MSPGPSDRGVRDGTDADDDPAAAVAGAFAAS